MFRIILVLFAVILVPCGVDARATLDSDGLTFIFAPGENDAEARWGAVVVGPDGHTESTGIRAIHTPDGKGDGVAFEYSPEGNYEIMLVNYGPNKSRLGHVYVWARNDQETVFAPDHDVEIDEIVTFSYEYKHSDAKVPVTKRPKQAHHRGQGKKGRHLGHGHRR